MSQLTEKELSAIEDELSSEQTIISKMKAYSQMCSDQELKQKCDSIAKKHQSHFDQLMSFLG
ncbi:MAG TPA: spore coat protein [Caproicibacter sp.]|nr:spore coat protein [Caproicibacter sp.]